MHLSDDKSIFMDVKRKNLQEMILMVKVNQLVQIIKKIR